MEFKARVQLGETAGGMVWVEVRGALKGIAQGSELSGLLIDDIFLLFLGRRAISGAVWVLHRRSQVSSVH